METQDVLDFGVVSLRTTLMKQLANQKLILCRLEMKRKKMIDAHAVKPGEIFTQKERRVRNQNWARELGKLNDSVHEVRRKVHDLEKQRNPSVSHQALQS